MRGEGGREGGREREGKNNHGSNLLAQYTNSDSDSSNISTSSNTAACCDSTTLCGNTTLARRSTVYKHCTLHCSSCWPTHLTAAWVTISQRLWKSVCSYSIRSLTQCLHEHVFLILQQMTTWTGNICISKRKTFFFFATSKILHHTPADFMLNVNPDLPSHHLAYSYRHTITAFLTHYFHIPVGRVA